MRKIVLSAMACVAFMGSAFASNEIVLEKQVATIQSTTNNNGDDDDAIKCSVTLTDQYGNTVSMSCWFCNCSELGVDAEMLLEKRTEASQENEYILSR